MKDELNLTRQIFSGAIADTFADIKTALQSINSIDLHRKWDELYTVYAQLTSYVAQGMFDDGQEQIITYLKKELLILIADIKYEESRERPYKYYFQVSQIATNKTPVYDISRILQSLSLLEGNADSRSEYDKTINDLFEALWVNRKISDQEIALLKSSSEYIKEVAVAAISLAILEYWDINKLYYVFSELSTTTSVRYRVRLLWVFFVALNRYPYHIELYKKELLPLIEIADEFSPLASMIKQLYLKYLITTQTESDLTGLQSDLQTISSQILPIFLENKPDNQQKIVSLQDLMEQISPEDPLFEKLQGKMNQLGRYEENGADIMYLSMGQMKYFPFFSSLSSWFLPFDKNHSALLPYRKSDNQTSEIVSLFSSELCDSDSYSLLFSFDQLPFAGQNEKMQEMMLEGLRQRIEDKAEKEKISSTTIVENEILRYLRNLYRFYSLYPQKNDFLSPFHNSFIQGSSSVLERFGLKDIQFDTALFYFKHKNYSQAINVLLEILPEDRTNVDINLLLGISYLKTERYEQATIYFKQALLLDSNNLSILNYLAICYKKQERKAEAIDVYEKIRAIKSDDASVILSLARLYIDVKKEDKALPLLYQYELTTPDPEKVYPLIAWGLFLRQDWKKSETYYDKALERAPQNPLLFINKGHLFLAQNDIKKAIDNYQVAIKNSSIEDWQQEISKDTPILISLGVAPSTIHLISDTIKMQKNTILS